MVIAAVVGSGLMGTRIAVELARNGHCVKLYDRDPEILNNLPETVKSYKKDFLLIDNKLDGEILYMSRLSEALENVEFVFEAIIEDKNVKRQIFRQFRLFAPSTAILCTSSIKFTLDEIIPDFSMKERFMGVRFLFPIYANPEVEIRTDMTSMKTINRVKDMLTRMGKQPFPRSQGEPHKMLTNRQVEEYERNYKRSFGRHDSLDHSPNRATYNTDICPFCNKRCRNSYLEPCLHRIMCAHCSTLFYSRQDFCLICRKRIADVKTDL